jgi:putative endonuclease
MFQGRKTVSSSLGTSAEVQAEKFLVQQGLRPHARNYRCRLGEIDLIMQDADTLVFVEVRLRTNTRFSSAAESVDHRKQQKLLRAAQFYLQQHQLTESVQCRFDVVAFTGSRTIPEWIQNAFAG